MGHWGFFITADAQERMRRCVHTKSGKEDLMTVRGMHVKQVEDAHVGVDVLSQQSQ